MRELIYVEARPGGVAGGWQDAPAVLADPPLRPVFRRA
ncbi:hypothetical protein BKA01_008383 [Pseudonocardia eucalypti]|nr:hypothetical protein [Pseudonocardia eucalypti]